MTDTSLLKEKIDNSGKTITFLASTLNLSNQGFYNKLNGKTEFYSSEISKLSDELNLTKKERENIFFSKKVDW